tara:strand:+ start:495 stop:701 length:207 start_codon:yes stop_codon:yes gene_type:complete
LNGINKILYSFYDGCNNKDAFNTKVLKSIKSKTHESDALTGTTTMSQQVKAMMGILNEEMFSKFLMVT